MEVIRNNEERMKKQVRELSVENKKISDELREANIQLGELNRQMANYEKDKMSLAVSISLLLIIKDKKKVFKLLSLYILCYQNTKKRLSSALKNLDNLKWENEVLELRFEKVSFFFISSDTRKF